MKNAAITLVRNHSVKCPGLELGEPSWALWPLSGLYGTGNVCFPFLDRVLYLQLKVDPHELRSPKVLTS